MSQGFLATSPSDSFQTCQFGPQAGLAPARATCRRELRCIAVSTAGVLEALVLNVQSIAREWAGRKDQPSATASTAAPCSPPPKWSAVRLRRSQSHLIDKRMKASAISLALVVICIGRLVQANAQLSAVQAIKTTGPSAPCSDRDRTCNEVWQSVLDCGMLASQERFGCPPAHLSRMCIGLRGRIIAFWFADRVNASRFRTRAADVVGCVLKDQAVYRRFCV